MYSTYLLNPGSGTFVSQLPNSLGGFLLARSASAWMTPVVKRDSAATRAAMKTSASIGRERLIKAESRPTFDFSFSFGGVSLAGVLELRPRRMASRPERPL